jgi:hypothetical protein
MKLHLNVQSPDPELFPGLRLLAVADDKGRFELAPTAGPATLAPGAYDVLVRVLSDTSAPKCVRIVFGALAGGEIAYALEEAELGSWRARAVSNKAVARFALEIDAAVPARFVVSHAEISVREAEPSLGPSLKAAGLLAARALFRAAPEPVRAAVLASGSRRRALGRAAGAGDADAKAPSGGLLGARTANTEDLIARQADFAERAAIADGACDHDFVGEDAQPIGTKPRVRALAFYLPQFHTIPENDAWWGRGFTEWTNVTKAQPQFLGHEQPKLPGELGFYDLDRIEVLANQAALARAFGIEGFCFYYYWFAGRRLLERPLERLLARRDIDLPFCLCWANENWTRSWDGDGAKVLIAQQHGDDDHAAVFDDLSLYLQDPRAIRVQNKPMLLVYRPDIIPDAARLTAIWRERAQRRGIGELYLVATNAFGFDEPTRLGFDAIAEFPPHGVRQARIEAQLAWMNPAHGGAVFDYEAVVAGALDRYGKPPSRGAPTHPGVMPGWDNEARRPGRGVVYHRASPAAFERWLTGAADFAERAGTPEANFVFINAWNEWAEGAMLEPDRRRGRAYLAACARALSSRA